MERVEQPFAVALRDVVDGLVALIEEPMVGAPEEATELVLAMCREAGRLQVAAARLSTRADDDGLWATGGRAPSRTGWRRPPRCRSPGPASSSRRAAP